MNKLAKELGIELKPFCTRVVGLTDQLAQDILDRCVSLGAKPYQYIKTKQSPYAIYDTCSSSASSFRFLGVCGKRRDTFHCDNTTAFENNLLDYSEVLSYLQLQEVGNRLEPNEGMVDGSKKERLDNEIKELENTLEAKKRERSDL